MLVEGVVFSLRHRNLKHRTRKARYSKVVSTSTNTDIEFNFKYIKHRASAGSWRRGYECHTKGLVLEGYPEKNFYKGLVKGNFKDAYKTDLIFK